jgi:hypothetical protein
MLGIIINGLFSGVTEYFKGRQELKRVDLESKKKIIEAEANAKLAISEAKIRMAEKGQLNDYDLDKLAMQNMEKSWKDDFVLILFSVPMVSAFIPSLADDALKGFEVIAKMPEWYMWVYIGMIIVIFGMRGMFTKALEMISNKFNFKKDS